MKVVIVGLTFCVISTEPVSAPSEKKTVSSAMNEVGAEVVLSTQLSVVDQPLPASPFQIGQALLTTRLIAPVPLPMATPWRAPVVPVAAKAATSASCAPL